MLNNYKQNPREENWQNIEDDLQEDKQYQHIKSGFNNFTATPPIANWEAIEDRLSQPVGTRLSLSFRIAASIAFAVMSFVLLSDNTPKKFADVFVGLESHNNLSYDVCEDPEIIALDIVKPVLKKTKSKPKKSKAKSKQKQLLDIILAYDEDIESEVDSALIAELIRPVEILPEESMFATVGGSFLYYKEGNDFKKMYYLPEIDYQLEVPADSLEAIILKPIRP